jgi:Flp pilus assembly protein TadG
MARRLTRTTRRQRGDALVEFAMLGPILILVVFGILEMGRVLDAWIVVQNAAREGARAGAMVPSSDTQTPLSTAQTYLQNGLGGRIGVDVTLPAQAVQVTPSTNAVQVTAEADVRIYTPVVQSILSAQVPVRGTAVMRRQ